MKKVSLLLLVVCLVVVLLLTSCSSAYNETHELDFSDGAPTLDGMAMTLGEYRSIRLDDWVDWNAFISYDILRSYFGDFYAFGFYGGIVSGPLNTGGYRYVFIDKDHIRYTFDITEISDPVDLRDYNEQYYTEITSVQNKKDLRTAKEIGSYYGVYYYVGDIRYTYDHAKLAGIEWVTETHHFTLHTGYSESYNLENGSFVARLLQEDTAETAVAEFNSHIARCLVWRKFCRYWLPWILVTAILGGIVGFVYYRRKKATAEV